MSDSLATQVQQQAIHIHDRDLVVVAGAGSGKTYVLVQRYLALLDAHPEWPLNALVAITFTNKAAQEMRDRVRKALETRYAEAAPDQRDLWASRIAAMDSARIGTIHSLCASILRANAAEAGIDPAFEVLEEVNADILRDEALEQVMQAIVTTPDHPLNRLLVEYDPSLIHSTLTQLLEVDLEPLPDNLMQRWQALWQAHGWQHITALRQNRAYQAAVAWQAPHGWPSNDDKLMDIWTSSRSLIETLNSADDFNLVMEALERLKKSINLRGGSKSNWGSEEAFNQAKAALKTIRAAVEQALDEIGAPPDALDERAAALLPLWAELIRLSQAAYRSTKQEGAQLDFDDLERLTSQLLSDHEAVRQRYQKGEFKHLLIDEFQDTNQRQWNIAQALTPATGEGSLFVVGDPKQSIYAFRGADVSVFNDVQRTITEAGGDQLALATSFRTHRTLVTALNALFAQILVRDPTSPVRAYQVELGEGMTAHRPDSPDDAPPIELILIDKQYAAEDADDKEHLRQWEAYALGKRLGELVAAGRLIFDKEQRERRPILYRDMAILFQATSSINLYEDIFKAVGLPFVTISGRGYYSRQEVWDLIDLLTALHNPGDDLALASALRSPLFALSDDALLALRLQRAADGNRLSLWQAVQEPVDPPEEDAERLRFVSDVLRRLRQQVGRVTIAELLRGALDMTGYLATLTGLPDGAQRRGNVEKLLDKAEASGQITLGVFQQMLRDLTTPEVREGQAAVDAQNAVTLMSVHASKGLEFPLVALADVGWKRNAYERRAALYDPLVGLVCQVYDEAENKLVEPASYLQARRLDEARLTAERKRLLYVAATRAQDYLLLSGQLPTGDAEKMGNSWMDWLWRALRLSDVTLVAGTQVVTIPEVGAVRLTIPPTPPGDDELALGSKESAALWDDPVIQQGNPLALQGDVPTLLGSIPKDRTAIARHMTASQIADLGAAAIDDFYARKVRQNLLHEAPATIDRIRYQPQEVSRRIIGEMVHRVLGYSVIPQGEALNLGLVNYAWQLGVVDQRQQEYAVREAVRLLHDTLTSPIYDAMRQATRLYREIPFVYRAQQRVVHGVLDVLFQRADGVWVVLDYKTSHVPGYHSPVDQQVVVEHARRYHLQVGVYAAAAQQQLLAVTGQSITPDVFIHYIRYGETVQVTTAEWMDALTQLEQKIGRLLLDEE